MTGPVSSESMNLDRRVC